MRRWDVMLGSIFAALLAAAAVLSLRGGEVALGGRPLGATCPWHWLGLECPFCGMTRSFVAVVHGDLGAALGFHPAGPLLALAFAGSIVAMAALALGRRRPLAGRPGYVRFLEVMALGCLLCGTARWLV